MAFATEDITLKLKRILKRQFTFSFTVSVAGVCAVLFLVCFLCYIGWEYYWYNTIGLRFIKWHTHIFATAFIFFPVVIPVILFRLFKPSYKSVYPLILSFSVWGAFICTEVIYVVSGEMKTYMESRFGYYQPVGLYDTANIYHLPRGTFIDDNSPEFSYRRAINSLGFTGSEWKTEKDSGVFRIIALGDSFTEGCGAPADSSFPAVLQQILLARGFKAEVLNAGVSGSDPVFGYKNLHDRLLPYKPDLVINAISQNDVMHDFYTRGGFERYTTDSTMRPCKVYPAETLYALSYVLRIFMNLAGYNFTTPIESDTEGKGQAILQTASQKFDSLASSHNFKVAMVFFPLRPEYLNSDYFFENHTVETLNRKNVTGINLKNCYQNSFGNPDKERMYWPNDRHHTSAGYRLMATCLANGLAENSLLPGRR